MPYLQLGARHISLFAISLLLFSSPLTATSLQQNTSAVTMRKITPVITYLLEGKASNKVYLALMRIKAYANGNGNMPELQDYLDAGLDGITESDASWLNVALPSYLGEEVDSTNELRMILTRLRMRANSQFEGGGALSLGGKGGIICEVTSLNDSGEGTLRECLTGDGYRHKARTIIFKTAGYIHLEHYILVENDAYITIAGQTAPGDGITLVLPSVPNDSVLEFKNVHDLILQYIRIRKGGGAADALNMGSNLFITGDSHDIVVDHCSLSWSGDENFGLWNVHPDGTRAPRRISFQWNISAESLHHLNNDGKHADSTGFLAGASKNPETLKAISIHHNFFSRNRNRNPIFKGGSADISANLIYNWEWMATAIRGGAIVDIVDNVYTIGPARSGALRTEVTYVFATPGKASTGVDRDPSIFMAGNIGYRNSDPNADGWESMIHVEDENWSYVNGEITPLSREYQRSSMRMQPQPVSRESVDRLPEKLLASEGVGASRRLDGDGRWVTSRDQVDHRMVADYEQQRGDSLVDDVDDVGGWPYYDQNGTYQYVAEADFIAHPERYMLNSGVAYIDSDHDGMPDRWEDAHELDKNDASDRNDRSILNGYNNLELFLSGRSPN
jgi:pectate lyase